MNHLDKNNVNAAIRPVLVYLNCAIELEPYEQ